MEQEVQKYVEEKNWEKIVTTLTQHPKLKKYGLLCTLGQVSNKFKLLHIMTITISVTITIVIMLKHFYF